MIECEKFESSESLLRKVIDQKCNHIFLCGKYSTELQIILIDLIADVKDRRFLFSRYDTLDDESVWDFLFLNRFEFTDQYSFFIPIFDDEGDALGACHRMFSIAGRLTAIECKAR